MLQLLLNVELSNWVTTLSRDVAELIFRSTTQREDGGSRLASFGSRRCALCAGGREGRCIIDSQRGNHTPDILLQFYAVYTVQVKWTLIFCKVPTITKTQSQN